jgi:hypothetical protein
MASDASILSDALNWKKESSLRKHNGSKVHFAKFSSGCRIMVAKIDDIINENFFWLLSLRY